MQYSTKSISNASKTAFSVIRQKMILVLACLTTFAATTHLVAPSARANSPDVSGSGSTSNSCSGDITTRDGSEHYVSIYAYQYAYVYRGRLESHSYSLNVSGILGDERDYRPVGVAGHWVIFRGRFFLLAIPWKDGLSVYVCQGYGGPMGAGWQRLDE